LARCYEALAQQARQLTQKHAATAALAWTVTRRVGEASSIDGAAEGLTPLLKVATDLPAVLAPIEDSSLLDLACASLVEARPNDWREQLIAVLPSLASSSCDHVVKRLIDGGCSTVDLEPVLQKIFASPIKCFDALLWLWDGPSDASLAAKVVPLTILTRVLRTLDECRRSETVPKEIGKKIAARARAMLSARRFGRFVACVGGIEGGMALALRTQISQLDNLGRAVREDLLTQLKPFLPQAEPKPVVEPWSREDVLYATKAGLARKQEEIDHLVRVKMKENAIAIGAAAERGDLSENSEYKFALEERDLLRARLAQMNSEVSMAQVISSRDVPTDRIGIGSRVVFRRVNDGESYQIVFVGPWDADSSKVWINYKAPLAQSVMGKRVGDVIQFDHTGAVGEYEVVELHNALVE
jgi:transcription elongation factor GreA